MKSFRFLLVGLGVLGFMSTVVAQVAPTFMPGDDVIAAAAGNQTTPALALGGTQILAVWADSRSSPIFTGQQSAMDIWATRLDANGATLDPTPIAVTVAGGDQRAPRVAWNGSHWLVVWVGRVPTAGYYTDGLLAARVAPDGTVLDGNPILVQADLGSGTFGDVASDGNGWVVFFTGWSGSTSQVLGRRVTANGSLPDAAPNVVATPGSSPYTPFGVTADWAGTRYLVAWSQWSSGLDNVRGQMVNAVLAPQGATFDIASHPDYEVNPDVASDGNQFFVVWDRYNNCCVGGASKVYGTRVTTAGAVLDGPHGVAIYDTNGYGFQGSDPAVAWDGAQWVASWTEPGTGGLRVNAGRISAAGVVLDFNGFEVDAAPFRQEASAVVGRPGGGSLVAWQDSRATVGQANDIYATRLDMAAALVPLGSLANAAPAQVVADAAPGPNGGALLAWSSMASGLTRVMVQRLGLGGHAVGLPVEVAAATVVNSVHVAWNGSLWMVVWDQYPNGVKARRFDAALAPLDAVPIPVMSGYSPDVAAQGDTFLVTALVPQAYPQFVDVLSRRVSGATGALLDPAPVFVGGTYATAQRVEAFSGGFLVAWERHPTHDNPWSTVGLRFVSALNVAATQTSLGSSSNYNARPALAVGATTALVVWQKNPSTSISEDIEARLVVGSGLALPGGNIVVSNAALSQQLPTVAWDGAQYVVAWQDTRANGPTWLFDRRADIYAARVTEAGAVLDPSGIPLATDFAPEGWPTAVGLGTGSALVAWSDLQPQSPFGGYRLGMTAVGYVPPWTDLGQGLAGVNGVPSLVGAGTLVAGTPTELLLTQAAPLAPTALVIGMTQLAMPLLGGILVPSPDQVIFDFTTDPAGSILLTATWPAGVASGANFYFQYWIVDAAAPQGLSATNGIKAVAP